MSFYPHPLLLVNISHRRCPQVSDSAIGRGSAGVRYLEEAIVAGANSEKHSLWVGNGETRSCDGTAAEASAFRVRRAQGGVRFRGARSEAFGSATGSSRRMPSGRNSAMDSGFWESCPLFFSSLSDVPGCENLVHALTLLVAYFSLFTTFTTSFTTRTRTSL